MQTESLIANIRKAIATNNNDWLELLLDNYRWHYYDSGYNAAIEKFTKGVECCDEEGNTIGTVKYYFERGDMSVGITDFECFILTETQVDTN